MVNRTRNERRYATHIVSSLLNGFSKLGVHAILRIHNGRSLLHYPKSLNEWFRQALSGSANVKILQRPKASLAIGKPLNMTNLPLSLGTPVPVGGNLELSKGVSLYAESLLRLMRGRKVGRLDHTLPTQRSCRARTILKYDEENDLAEGTRNLVLETELEACNSYIERNKHGNDITCRGEEKCR